MPDKSWPTALPFGPYLPSVALSLLTLIGAMAASMKAPASGPVAMVFPPWWSASQTVMAASGSGSVIRLGSLPFVAVVAPANARERARLHQAGALFLLDLIVVSGCLQTANQDSQ